MAKDDSPTMFHRFHASRLLQRDISQLLGICEFALQDGYIDQEEAEQILIWLQNHQSCLHTWPANVLYDRLNACLARRELSPAEQGELLALVASIAMPRDADGTRIPTTLPLNDPAPPIVFKRRSFCFTGKFISGPRAECHALVVAQGGKAWDRVVTALDYLVIGQVGSEQWRHTSFGAKIAQAVKYREAGHPVAIVSEEHWLAQIR